MNNRAWTKLNVVGSVFGIIFLLRETLFNYLNIYKGFRVMQWSILLAQFRSFLVSVFITFLGCLYIVAVAQLEYHLVSVAEGKTFLKCKVLGPNPRVNVNSSIQKHPLDKSQIRRNVRFELHYQK